MSYSWTSAQKNADDEIQSLLQQLRRTQDESSPEAKEDTSVTATPEGGPSEAATTEPSPPTQAQLDALLQSLTTSHASPLPSHAVASAVVSPPTKSNLQSMSFPESLPRLQALSLDSEFLDQLGDLKREQDDTELRLRDERNRLKDELAREAMPEFRQKAKLKEWDRQALITWKKLKESQQIALMQMGVPTFSLTKDPIVLKRQERVMTVLSGFLED